MGMSALAVDASDELGLSSPRGREAVLKALRCGRILTHRCMLPRGYPAAASAALVRCCCCSAAAAGEQGPGRAVGGREGSGGGILGGARGTGGSGLES